MAYKVLDIARYVINYCIDDTELRLMSNLKLQKVMYYIQAAFLIETGDIAFKESISAWRYGPVVEEVYHEFKQYVNSNIDDKMNTEIVVKNKDASWIYKIEQYNPADRIKDIDKRIIEDVIRGQDKFTAFQLVARTHEELPWKEAVDKGHQYIDINTMRQYFTKHGERIYGE